MRDLHTRTVEDAARWERHHTPGWDRPDQPSAAELAADAAEDEAAARRQQTADARAREQGHYVPSPLMRLTAAALGMSLAQRGILDVDVDPAREGVLVVRHRHRRPTTPTDTVAAAVTDALTGPEYAAQVVTRDDRVWVRLDRHPLTTDPPF